MNNFGVLSLSSLQNMIVALRILAYGIASDFINEYLRIGACTEMKSLKKFQSSSWKLSLRILDISRLVATGEINDYPEILGSIEYAWDVEELPKGMERGIYWSCPWINTYFCSSSFIWSPDMACVSSWISYWYLSTKKVICQRSTGTYTYFYTSFYFWHAIEKHDLMHSWTSRLHLLNFPYRIFFLFVV